MRKEIPIFFSADDNYIPYLDVAILSLISNASKEYEYRIFILNTGLNEANVSKIKQNERKGFNIQFVNIAKDVDNIKKQLKDVYHFSIASYYRLFIASLFPQYEKILYLDCDIVVLGDVSKLYNVELGKNILGAAPEQFVQSTREFRAYAEKALDVNPDSYVNSGVLLMNLKEFRANKIEEKFLRLITDYDFDLLDPDQAYLNYLCKDKIYILPNGWNKEPTDFACEGDKNIVHYALYKKPWQFDNVIDGEYFWHYAKQSIFYEEIYKRKKNFGAPEIQKKETMAEEILDHALKITESRYTFKKMLCKS